MKEGEKLSDILSMPVKDALGREVCVNYDEDIVNVKDILDATNARKNIFNDSVELQKLSLKQIALIHMYESDAEQVSLNEIQRQTQEHKDMVKIAFSRLSNG